VREGAQRVEDKLASPEASPSPRDAATSAIVRVVAEELEEFRQDRLVMAGAATLARSESDFRGSIYPLLEAIEEQVTLMKLMSEMVADDHGLAASIGRENEPFGLMEASVVAGEYDTPGARARLGVLGPTRMDYPTNFAAVRAVARYLTRMLDEDDTAR
jgi:heat-inducible transcriptional repressor